MPNQERQRHIPKTKNPVDEWHRVMKGIIGYVQPMCLKHIDFLQPEQNAAGNKLNSLQARNVFPNFTGIKRMPGEVKTSSKFIETYQLSSLLMDSRTTLVLFRM